MIFQIVPTSINTITSHKNGLRFKDTGTDSTIIARIKKKETSTYLKPPPLQPAYRYLTYSLEERCTLHLSGVWSMRMIGRVKEAKTLGFHCYPLARKLVMAVFTSELLHTKGIILSSISSSEATVF